MTRHIRGLLRGDYGSARQAALACWRALARAFRRDPRSADFPVRRPYLGVRTRLIERSRRAGRPVAQMRWSAAERRILDDYARAVAQGRFRDATEASRACARHLDRLRLRYPHASWLAARRTERAIYEALRPRALALGRRPARVDWSPEARRLLDHWARRVLRGRCPSARRAAREFLAEVGRLRRRYPGLAWLCVRRTFRAVHTQIWMRARELGRSRLSVDWSPLELRVVDRYARSLLAGRFPSARPAAEECSREIDRLHATHATAIWAGIRRTPVAVRDKIHQRAHVLGDAWRRAFWTPAELVTLDRYARAVVRGAYPSVRQAIGPCHRDLARLHARRRKKLGLGGTSPLRTLSAVQARLVQRTLGLGRAPKLRWRRAELEVARKWAQKYRGREIRPTAGARMLSRDLGRLGYKRGEAACSGMLGRLVAGRAGG